MKIRLEGLKHNIDFGAGGGGTQGEGIDRNTIQKRATL